jgi:sarcosine oxidase, subunit beta
VAVERVEVVILGAGIAGSALAYHLVRRSVGPTVLYDPRTPAAGATGRAAGIVTEQLWNEWDIAVTRDARAEYRELAARRDPAAFTQNGFLRWTAEPEAARVLEEATVRLRAWGVDVRPIDRAGLEARVPWARFSDVAGAIFSPADAVVTPSTINEIYVEEARHGGVDVELGTAFRRATSSEGGWEVEVGTRSLRARQLVVAAGAWSKQLLHTLGHPLPLAPYRTQAATLRPPPGGPEVFPSVHDIDLDVYARPEGNGRILAGDGTELFEVDPDRTPSGGDEQFLTHLAESFAARFPGWAEAELVRAWSGVCTSTPDRRPLVGPVEGAPGLSVMVGFNGFGVMRAGGVARRLASVLAAGDGSTRELVALAPVLPSRFPPGTPVAVPRPGFTLEGGDAPRF